MGKIGCGTKTEQFTLHPGIIGQIALHLVITGSFAIINCDRDVLVVGSVRVKRRQNNRAKWRLPSA